MQKVVGSSPIIRSSKAPLRRGFLFPGSFTMSTFELRDAHALDPFASGRDDRLRSYPPDESCSLASPSFKATRIRSTDRSASGPRSEPGSKEPASFLAIFD